MYYILLIICILLFLIIRYVITKTVYENFDTNAEEPFDNFFVELYDDVFNYDYLFKYDIKCISKYIKPEMKIIDAGTGVGRHYAELYKLNKNVIGIDKSDRMLKKARLRNVLGKFNNIDLIDAKIDAVDMIVCLQETLYHNNDEKIDKILRNFYSWLNKTGILAIHIFNTDKLDPAPVAHSQYYFDDHGIKHAITYMKGYIHDAWWNNGKYYQRVIIDNLNKQTVLNLNMIEKEKILEKILNAGFKVKEIIDYKNLDIGQYDMYIFQKNI